MIDAYNPAAAIEITALSKDYPRGKTTVKAVDNLNLSVETGQVFGFLGANGAGKTTTIKMICGVITPSSGHIRVNGYDVTRQRSMAMRQIGAVLEGTRNVYWRLSAWQNLMYFGHLKGSWGKKLALHSEQLLRELDLWERRNETVRTFSRGMQQKVAIACSLIGDPSIILLDEPTLGLDFQASRTVKEWITRLTREQGKTVVLTTHQLDVAQELCDHVAIIRQGQLLADKPLKELLHLFKQEYYQIKVKGELEHEQATWFDGLTLNVENGETLLTGSIADQDTLYQHLSRLRDHNLPLLTVNRIEANLEEVFMHVLEKGEENDSRVVSYVQ